jgi:menaquinol-cytochrome c reductase iron-sulfur subunit
MADPDGRLTRRRFAIVGTQVVAGVVTVALGVPIVGFLLSPLFRRQTVVEREVGYVGDISGADPQKFIITFPQNAWPVPDVSVAVFVVRVGAGFKVLSNVCSHMQCPVRWAHDLNQFLCPCHGGLYDRTGLNIGGPPPKPLPEYVHRVDSNGVLYVQNRFTEQI